MNSSNLSARNDGHQKQPIFVDFEEAAVDGTHHSFHDISGASKPLLSAFRTLSPHERSAASHAHSQSYLTTRGGQSGGKAAKAPYVVDHNVFGLNTKYGTSLEAAVAGAGAAARHELTPSREGSGSRSRDRSMTTIADPSRSHSVSVEYSIPMYPMTEPAGNNNTNNNGLYHNDRILQPSATVQQQRGKSTNVEDALKYIYRTKTLPPSQPLANYGDGPMNYKPTRGNSQNEQPTSMQTDAGTANTTPIIESPSRYLRNLKAVGGATHQSNNQNGTTSQKGKGDEGLRSTAAKLERALARMEKEAIQHGERLREEAKLRNDHHVSDEQQQQRQRRQQQQGATNVLGSKTETSANRSEAAPNVGLRLNRYGMPIMTSLTHQRPTASTNTAATTSASASMNSARQQQQSSVKPNVNRSLLLGLNDDEVQAYPVGTDSGTIAGGPSANDNKGLHFGDSMAKKNTDLMGSMTTRTTPPSSLVATPRLSEHTLVMGVGVANRNVGDKADGNQEEDDTDDEVIMVTLNKKDEMRVIISPSSPTSPRRQHQNQHHEDFARPNNALVVSSSSRVGGVGANEDFLLSNHEMLHQLLLFQRREMFTEISHHRNEILGQAEMLREKAFAELVDIREDGKAIIDTVSKNIESTGASIRQREAELFKIQKDFNEHMAVTVSKLVEREFELVAREQEMAVRRKQLEEWSARIHSELMVRELNIARISREAQRDANMLVVRQQEAAKLRMRLLKAQVDDGLASAGGAESSVMNAAKNNTAKTPLFIAAEIVLDLADGTSVADGEQDGLYIRRIVPGQPLTISGSVVPRRYQSVLVRVSRNKQRSRTRANSVAAADQQQRSKRRSPSHTRARGPSIASSTAASTSSPTTHAHQHNYYYRTASTASGSTSLHRVPSSLSSRKGIKNAHPIGRMVASPTSNNGGYGAFPAPPPIPSAAIKKTKCGKRPQEVPPLDNRMDDSEEEEESEYELIDLNEAEEGDFDSDFGVDVAAFAGMPVCISYYQGKDGSLSSGRKGGVLSGTIGPDGRFEISNILFTQNESREDEKNDHITTLFSSGSSHSLLVTVPVSANGSVKAAQLTLSTRATHLFVPRCKLLGSASTRHSQSSPDRVKAIPFAVGGEWDPETCRLAGLLTFPFIEPFGLFGVSVDATLTFLGATGDHTSGTDDKNENNGTKKRAEMFEEEGESSHSTLLSGTYTLDASPPQSPNSANPAAKSIKSFRLSASFSMFGNELNRFPFSVNMLSVSGCPPTWDDLMYPDRRRYYETLYGAPHSQSPYHVSDEGQFGLRSRVFLKIRVPSTPYSEAFEHEFEIDTIDANSERPHFSYDVIKDNKISTSNITDNTNYLGEEFDAYIEMTAPIAVVDASRDICSTIASPRQLQKKQESTPEAKSGKTGGVSEVSQTADNAGVEYAVSNKESLFEGSSKPFTSDGHALATPHEQEHGTKVEEGKGKDNNKRDVDEDKDMEEDARAIGYESPSFANRQKMERENGTESPVDANTETKTPQAKGTGEVEDTSEHAQDEGYHASPQHVALAPADVTDPGVADGEGREDLFEHWEDQRQQFASDGTVDKSDERKKNDDSDEASGDVSHAPSPPPAFRQPYLDFRAISVPIHDVIIGAKISSDGNLLAVVDARGTLRIFIKKAAASKLEALREGSPKSAAAASAIVNTSQAASASPHRTPAVRSSETEANRGEGDEGNNHEIDNENQTRAAAPDREEESRMPDATANAPPLLPRQDLSLHYYWSEIHAIAPPDGQPFSGVIAWAPITSAWAPTSSASVARAASPAAASSPSSSNLYPYPPEAKIAVFHPHTQTMYVWSLNLLKELVEATLKSSPHQGAGILHGGRHGGRSRSNNNTPKRAGRSDGGPDDETDHSRRKSPRNHHHDPYGRSTTPTRSTINTTNSGMAPLVVLSLSLCEPAAKKIVMPDSYILATTGPDGGSGTPSRRRSANSSRAPSRSGTPSKTRKGGGVVVGGNVPSIKQNIDENQTMSNYSANRQQEQEREQQSFSFHASPGSKNPHHHSTLTSEQPKAHEDYTTDPSSISFVTDAYTTHDEAEAEAAGEQKTKEARQLNYSSQDNTAIKNTINKSSHADNVMTTPRRPRSYSTLLIGRSVVDPAAVVFEAHFASANTIVLVNRYGHVYYGVLTSGVGQNSDDTHESFFVCIYGGTASATEENNDGYENEKNSTNERQHKKLVSSAIRATCLATAPSVSDELAFIGYSDLSIRAISLEGPNIVFVLPPPSTSSAPSTSQEKGEDTMADSLLGEVSRPLRFFGASPYGPFMYFAHAFGVVMVKVVATPKRIVGDTPRSGETPNGPSGSFRSEEANGDDNKKANGKQQNSDETPSLPRFSIAATRYSAEEISIGDTSQGGGDGGQVAKLFAVVPIDRSLAALLYDTNDCFLVDFGYLRSNPEKFIVSSCVLGDEDPDVAIQNSMDFAKTTVVPQVAVDTSLVLGVDAMGPLCWQIGLAKM